jgi:hypothetical protein
LVLAALLHLWHCQAVSSSGEVVFQYPRQHSCSEHPNKGMDRQSLLRVNRD